MKKIIFIFVMLFNLSAIAQKVNPSIPFNLPSQAGSPSGYSVGIMF